MSSFLGGGGGGTGGFPKAVANQTYYVATTGSDSNPGTLAQPFATVQHAINVIGGFDWRPSGQFSATINVAAGTYTGQPHWIINEIFGDPNINITGDNTTPSNVIFQSFGSQGGVVNTGSGTVIVLGFEFQMSSFGAVFTAQGSAAIEYGSIKLTGSNIIAFAQNTAPNNVAGASIGQTGSPTIDLTGVTQMFFFLSGQFLLNFFMHSCTINFPATLTIGQQFFNVTNACQTAWNTNTFTNFAGVTGSSLSTLNDCIFVTDNGLPSDIPGTTGVAKIDNSCKFTHGGPSSSLSVISVAGAPVDPTNITGVPGWAVFKDKTNGQRYFAIDDGGTIYVKQIGRFINAQTGASYTLALSDQDGRIEMNNAGANTVTVPTNATVAFPVTTEIRITQTGSGTTTISPAGGVTVHNNGTIAAQWDSALLYKRATDEWVMTLA